ncbi:hypothetical protein ACPV47_19615 [Vibrio jasicida]|uniref:hypothetical protein n=1 Tax=Vibrio jasicida TaxID=766224 RepID=UPI004067D2F8
MPLEKAKLANAGQWHISPAMNLNSENTKEIEVLKLIFWLFKREALPTKPKPFNSKTLCLQQLSNALLRGEQRNTDAAAYHLNH